jgi:predicted RNA binding protein YcfA (HicA-like mRNA interferase family)
LNNPVGTGLFLDLLIDKPLEEAFRCVVFGALGKLNKLVYHTGYKLLVFVSGLEHRQRTWPTNRRLLYSLKLDLADSLPRVADRKAFIFSTCGAPAFIVTQGFILKNHSALREKLEAKGYALTRTTGSHRVFTKPGARSIPIPVHKGKVKPAYVRMVEKLEA